jgi:dihydropteroate synthase
MTKIVGILNITPDSFFDGGHYDEKENALKQLRVLLSQGVDIIDAGAESTRPNATPISADEELKRLEDILPLILLEVQKHNQKNQSQIEVSLDSRHAKVVAWALELGIDIINDVSGFEDWEMVELAVKSGKKIVVMHNLGVPANKQKIIDENLDVVEVLIDWIQNKLTQLLKLGVKKEQIIFDIGVGFGKNAQQSINLIKEIERFRVLNLPLYVGHSNKSFLDEWKIDGCKTREEKTVEVSNYLIAKNVEYLRLHNFGN